MIIRVKQIRAIDRYRHSYIETYVWTSQEQQSKTLQQMHTEKREDTKHDIKDSYPTTRGDKD